MGWKGRGHARVSQVLITGDYPPPKYLTERTDLRDQFKVCLSASAQEAGNDIGPEVSDLDNRIKALKSAETIDTAPQHVKRKQAATGADGVKCRCFVVCGQT